MAVRLIRDQFVLSAELSPEQLARQAFDTLGAFAAEFIGAGWSADEVFWSRYFWIRTYGNLVSHRAADEGVEQFIFKVLEQPFPSCNPDWANAERVEMLAAEQAESWRP